MASLLKVVEIVNPVFGLRAARLRLASHPFKLCAQEVLHLGKLSREAFHTLLALTQII